MKVQELMGNETGIRGELEAIDYLNSIGYKVIASNVKFEKIGELDVIAMDGETLVFVEVKKRDTPEYDALAAITKNKMRKIVRCAELYLAETQIKYYDVRFDVIGINIDKLEHIKNAFYGHWM